uniref:Uncharacterized protein n=1 Tax=Glycine max TaxID=3847 RepID=C6TLV9_SOYBN|nr:unknown [Glycine max]
MKLTPKDNKNLICGLQFGKMTLGFLICGFSAANSFHFPRAPSIRDDMLHKLSPGCPFVVTGALDLDAAFDFISESLLLLFPIPLASNQREPDCCWLEVPQSFFF